RLPDILADFTHVWCQRIERLQRAGPRTLERKIQIRQERIVGGIGRGRGSSGRDGNEMVRDRSANGGDTRAITRTPLGSVTRAETNANHEACGRRPVDPPGYSPATGWAHMTGDDRAGKADDARRPAKVL